MGGVDPVDVGRGIGLRITQLLRLMEHGLEFPHLAGPHGLVHRRHDVVAGAVQDPVNAAEPVAREALAERLDDGDAAGDGGFVTEMTMRPLRGLGERRAVMGEQRLVGRHQMLAVGESRLRERPRGALRPADQFDDDIDGGVGGERSGVIPPLDPAERDPAILALVARRDRNHLDRPARPLLEQRCVVAQEREHATADRAQSGNGDTERLSHGGGLLPAWVAARGEGGRPIPGCPAQQGNDRSRWDESLSEPVGWRVVGHAGGGRRALGSDERDARRDHPPFAGAGSVASSAG